VSEFDRRAARAIEDASLRGALRNVQDRTGTRREAALSEVRDLEGTRQQAADLRARTVDDLDTHLARFVSQVEAAGGRVHHAADASAARTLVTELALARGVERVVKGKSMVTEEIGLNAALEEAGLEVLETDLGEYIVQLSGERPSHIIVPAIHKTRRQVQELFNRHGADSLSDDPAELTRHARVVLREAFVAAQMGITGCNFGVAATGSVVVVTNEGNGRMASTLPPLHVVVMGRERLVPELSDLDAVLTLLPRAATGQRATSYVSLITGPRRAGEQDGPEELHVVIVDNGRSALRGTPFQDLLHCIRCGACLNVCPVYRQIGGHAYEQVIPGPIGVALQGAVDPELPWACSLCGACGEVCPVGIPLQERILGRRQQNWSKSSVRDHLAGAAFAAVASRPWAWKQVVRLSPPRQSFRAWWKAQEDTHGDAGGRGGAAGGEPGGGAGRPGGPRRRRGPL